MTSLFHAVGALICCTVLLAGPVAKAQDDVDALQILATKGDPDAQNKLALAYQKGNGVAQNYVQARKWLEQAVAQNFPKAQANLGAMLVFGKGGPKDVKRGIGLYQKAAAVGIHAAQYNLGLLYEEGKVIKRDIPKAIELYKTALEEPNYSWPQYRLGEIHRRGKLGSPDPQEAIHWYREAAHRGHTDAKYQLALLLMSNHPGDTSDAQAFILMTAAETDGHKKAALKARTLERKLKLNFSPKQKKNIYRLINLSPQELVFNANKYANGLGSIKPDIALSKFYYALAYAKSPSTGSFALGVQHALKGTQRDAGLAEEYFQKAAAQGKDEAYYNLGWLHYTGALENSDDTKAFEYLTKATSPWTMADTYNPKLRSKAANYADLMLGVMHFKGRGTQQNLDKALELFTLLSFQFIQSGKDGYPEKYTDLFALNFKGEVEKEIRRRNKNVRLSDEGFLFHEEGSQTPLTVRMSGLIGEKSADWEHCGYAPVVKAFRKYVMEAVNKARTDKGKKLLLERIKRAYEKRKKNLRIAEIGTCNSPEATLGMMKTLLAFMQFDWGLKTPPKDFGMEVSFNGNILRIESDFDNPIVKKFKPELIRFPE